MFTRLLIVSLAVILACVGVLSAVTYVNLRNNSIRDRTNALKTHAKEIAHLAGVLSFDSISTIRGNSVMYDYMRWKSKQLHDDYNAYFRVVDRTRKTMYQSEDASELFEMLKKTITDEEMNGYMEKALSGQDVVQRTDSEAGPLFTVLVPWVQDNQLTRQHTVVGFVLVQTAAQTVHAVYQGMVWQTLLVAVGIFIVAATALFFMARQMTRPVTAMAQAAGDFARGHFDARAPEEGGKEIKELSHAFNHMAAQLSTLEQSRRDFVANVSHELRSPITSIKGFAQGMLDGTIPKEMHGQYLQVVVDETQRLAKLINSLLNLSRMENEEISLAYSNFDINELTRRVLISRMTPIDEKQLEIEVDFKSDPCFVWADADQIQQVVINLLDNAIKYTPEKGTVWITTLQEGGHIALRVRDNGIGIPPQDAPYIFDRFYKVDKAHTVGKGTGLGLAICKRIMERHNQSIRLISGQGGAEFEITLEKGTAQGGNHGTAGAGEN